MLNTKKYTVEDAVVTLFDSFDAINFLSINHGIEAESCTRVSSKFDSGKNITLTLSKGSYLSNLALLNIIIFMTMMLS